MRAYRSLCGAAAVFTLAAHLAAQNAPPNPQAADDHFVIDTGARLYVGQCSACHGTNGDLINGVDLRAGKFLTDDQLYNRINHTVDRLDRAVDQISSLIVDVNAGHGTLGKLLKEEDIYNDARQAVARFNTATERIDNMVSAAQRGEGTVGKLLTDEALYSNVNQLSSEGVKLIYDFRQNPKKYLTIKFELF